MTVYLAETDENPDDDFLSAVSEQASRDLDESNDGE